MIKSLLASIADSALEGTIVGSFTNLGYSARSSLFDWKPITTDLTGQIAIVTGGTSGIGKATAEGLLKLGAQVHITSRKQKRADKAAEEMKGTIETTNRCIGHSLDTGDFESIANFAQEISELGAGVDILINNAGALTSDYRTNERGTELTLSTHLIGPYLLMKKLRPNLTSGARVLFMSSGGMYTQGLKVEEIEVSESEYKGAVAYAKAKRGQVEMVTLLGPQWAPEIVMHSMHPGWVATAGVDAGLPGFGKIMRPLLRSAEQGADTMVWLAATGGDAKPGTFWHDREPRRTSYLPGTATNNGERKRLIEWLDLMTLPADH